MTRSPRARAHRDAAAAKGVDLVGEAVDEFLDGRLTDSVCRSPVDVPVCARARNVVATGDRELATAVSQGAELEVCFQ